MAVGERLLFVHSLRVALLSRVGHKVNRRGFFPEMHLFWLHVANVDWVRWKYERKKLE